MKIRLNPIKKPYVPPPQPLQQPQPQPVIKERYVYKQTLDYRQLIFMYMIVIVVLYMK